MPFWNEKESAWQEPPGHVRAYSRYLLGADRGSDRIDFRTSRYPQGGHVLPHVHDTAEQVYYFLSGTGEAECGDERRTVGAGDVMFVPPGVRHALTATSEDDLHFVVVTSPPEGIDR